MVDMEMVYEAVKYHFADKVLNVIVVTEHNMIQLEQVQDCFVDAMKVAYTLGRAAKTEEAQNTSTNTQSTQRRCPQCHSVCKKDLVCPNKQCLRYQGPQRTL